MTFLIFLAFVPLLVLEQRASEDRIAGKKSYLFLYSFLAFFTWNLLTTWWIYNASFGGAVMAIFFNSLFMAIVFVLFHRVKRRMNGRFGAIILISFWMAFEYLHLRWDLTWPWLTIGNVFADSPWMIQWYEYTGVFGGGLWIFAVNFLVFNQMKQGSSVFSIRSIFLISSLIFVPILISFSIYKWESGQLTKGPHPEIVVVQPNIDPYNEKFNGSFKEQLEKMLELAETGIDSNTACIAFPETALTENIWENSEEHAYSIQALRAFQKKHPGLDILIGATSAYQYQPGEKPSVTARKYIDAEEYYDDFNTAFFLTGKGLLQKYHKSKFVPGVERMPFPSLLKPLEKLAINMGGTTGSLGEQEERTVLLSSQNSLKIAPVICYESVFGEFVNGYILNGANVIFIITNDGWWGDTPGHTQHLSYARLRTIETRRCIARSANTGTSCFIDQWGKVFLPTSWWKPEVIKQGITLNSELTFYVRHGDYIGRAAVIISLGMIVFSIFLRFRRKKYNL